MEIFISAAVLNSFQLLTGHAENQRKKGVFEEREKNQMKWKSPQNIPWSYCRFCPAIDNVTAFLCKTVIVHIFE